MTRGIARTITIVLMGVMVIIATGDGFAQSYSGLYGWALEHKVTGWKAESFPLLVDLFIGVGELGLFLLAIDGHKLTRRALSWVDLLIPGATALGGWVVSLVFNVGHVQGGQFSDQATAAIPPVASMVGLVILLRTLHRYVDHAETAANATVPQPGRILSVIEDEPDPVYLHGARVFADDVTRGHVPGIRAIKQQLKVGQPKAREVRAYLQSLAAQ
ncbi:MAG: hypothetical protein JWN52_7215 [Actinomycetia bacterium]|nr:hypothetical protein [Actinomycetes bacterium]